MANYQLLKADIDAKVYENAHREITGEKLNSVLNAMVTTLGAEYQFAGVATIDTNPEITDAKVFYIANGKGTYTNFGSLEVTEDEVVILYWDSSWHKVSTGIASQAKLSELNGQTEMKFDFSTGSISAYSNRKVKYPFVKGEIYEIVVVTDNNSVETYFSLRTEESVVQNNICRGTGKRSAKFMANEDASYLYMSLETDGVPIIYDVLVNNLSKKNLQSAFNRISAIENVTQALSETPIFTDFILGKALSETGEIYNSSDYCTTEKYFIINKGSTLAIKNEGYASRTGLCVYNYDTLAFETSYSSKFSGEIFFNERKKLRFATLSANLKNFYAEVENGTVDEVMREIGYVTKDIYDDFEIGNISITNSGWVYSSSNKRVRLKSGTTYHLGAGDSIIMDDGVRAYIGKRTSNSYSIYSSWVTGKCTITEDGEYTILFALVNETELADKNEILSKVRILSKGGYYTHEVMAAIPTADDLPTLRVVNHRGYNTEAPENTESAYRLSKLKGFRYVETDVRFTSDNVPVLLHDTTIDRTSNGTGNISDMTYQEASSYDYGSWFSEKYEGEALLTFDRFILLCKTLGLLPYVELKSMPEGQEQILVNIVEKYGMQRFITWISFNIDFLRRINNVLPNARVGYVGDLSEDFISSALSLKNENNDVFVDIQGSSATEELIISARKQGLGVEMWNHSGINNPLLPLLDGITTDSTLLWEFMGDTPKWNV